MSKKVQFKGYISPNLRKQDKSVVKQNLLEDAQICDAIFGVIDDGYKFSCRMAETGGTFMASLYCYDRESSNAGYVLSIRHNDPVVAITGLFYFHGELYGGSWPTDDDTDW